MPRGPAPERPNPHNKLMTSLRRRYRASPRLLDRLDAAVKAHGPNILPVIADIGTRNQQAEAITIFAANRNSNVAMRRLLGSGAKPRKPTR